MRRHSRGQSVVEMAFVLPILVLVLFGIIDLSYYLYGYATIYQAARNGAERASEIPPYPSMISPTLDAQNDECVYTILKSIQSNATLFPDLTTGPDVDERIKISYPDGTRKLGSSVQVDVTYNVQPLTPLWNFVTFGNQGTMQVHTVVRRSIESLGMNPNKNYAPNLFACKDK